jgi:hypothetical protein
MTSDRTFTETLSPSLREALAAWTLSPGASREAIAAVEGTLRVTLPPDLVAFYLQSNGATGELGKTYLAIEPVEGIAARCADYDFGELAPELLLFGTNGGSEGFAVDRRTGRIVVVPLHLPTDEGAVVQGSFVAFLERVEKDTLFEG